MYKATWIILGICVFVIITLMAVSIDNPNYGHRIVFTNVTMAVRNANSEVINKTITSPNTVNVKTTTITKTETTPQTTSTTTYNTDYTDYNKKIERSYTTSKKNSGVVLTGYKNVDDSKLDEALDKSRNVKIERKEYGEYVPKYKTSKSDTTAYNKNSQYEKYGSNKKTTKDRYDDGAQEDAYGYDDIDWSRWKSNFVNKILDDSLKYEELDKYPNGAFFYYSFIVDYEGKISNIKIKSLYLSEADKQLMQRMIKSNERKPITRFPAKTNRKTAVVSAIMMLSNNETIHSKPSDFNDTERIKYKLK